MSAIRTIELPFAGGVFRFGLGPTELSCMEWGQRHPKDDIPIIAGLRQSVRIGELFSRLLRGRFSADGKDVGLPGAADFAAHELDTVIRQGLLGGGGGTVGGKVIDWDEYSVSSYMSEHVGSMPLSARWDLAVAIIGSCFDPD